MLPPQRLPTATPAVTASDDAYYAIAAIIAACHFDVSLRCHIFSLITFDIAVAMPPCCRYFHATFAADMPLRFSYATPFAAALR